MVDFPAHVSSPEGKDDDSSKNMQKLSLSGGRCCVFLSFESWMFNSSLPRAEEHPPGERTAWTVFHELEYSPQFWTNPNVIYDFISFHILGCIYHVTMLILCHSHWMSSLIPIWMKHHSYQVFNLDVQLSKPTGGEKSQMQPIELRKSSTEITLSERNGPQMLLVLKCFNVSSRW